MSPLLDKLYVIHYIFKYHIHKEIPMSKRSFDSKHSKAYKDSGKQMSSEFPQIASPQLGFNRSDSRKRLVSANVI